MPECWWYAKYGYCSAGDECLYAHPKERRIECPDYNRGFCKLGEFPSPPCFSRRRSGTRVNLAPRLCTLPRPDLSPQACAESSMSAVPHWVLPIGP